MHLISGSRRHVFIFDRVVVKIPRVTAWVDFVLGVMENLHERYWYCADGTVENRAEWYAENTSTNNLAQIFWADRFGLVVIMERVTAFTEDQVNTDEFKAAAEFLKARYAGLNFINDLKPSNVGIRADGRIVSIDYGFFPGTASWYLGRKVVCDKNKNPSLP